MCLLCYEYQIFVDRHYIGKSDYSHITFWQRNLPVMYMLLVTWSEWGLKTSLASLPCTMHIQEVQLAKVLVFVLYTFHKWCVHVTCLICMFRSWIIAFWVQEYPSLVPRPEEAKNKNRLLSATPQTTTVCSPAQPYWVALPMVLQAVQQSYSQALSPGVQGAGERAWE